MPDSSDDEPSHHDQQTDGSALFELSVPSDRGSDRRPSQAVVLLDGDRDCFVKEYIPGDHTGGKKAAIELRNRIVAVVQAKEGTSGPSPNVLIMLFRSKDGMTNFLTTQNAGQRFDLSAFAQGFSNSPFPAVAADTGFSPQSADQAILAHLRAHIRTADYIFLGGSHDGGYATALQQLDDQSLLGKIILLTTSGLCTQWHAALRLEEVKFKGLFEAGDGLHYNKYRIRNGAIDELLPREPSSADPPSAIPVMSRAQSAPAASVRPPQQISQPAPPSAVPSSSRQPAWATPLSVFPQGLQTAPQAWTSSAGTARVNVMDAYSRLSLRAAPAPSSSATDFGPLVVVLREHAKAGFHRPLCSKVGGELRQRHRRDLYTSFSAYTQEAKTRGLVNLGRGSTTGSDCIQLSLAPSFASQHLQQTVAVPFDFEPLLSKLRAQPDGIILCSTLGSLLGPFTYRQAGVDRFGPYIDRAVKLGLVRQGGPIAGAEWVALFR